MLLLPAVESLKPNLVVPSGSEVTVEMITHHAGDDQDKMIKVRKCDSHWLEGHTVVCTARPTALVPARLA